jgi:hypothetical protein
MLFYHRTPHTEAILSQGFRDGTGYYMTSVKHTGVWLSNIPLDCNEGAKGETVLAIEIPEEALLPYEWIEDEDWVEDETAPEGGRWVQSENWKPYREFLAPAELVNRYGLPRIHDHNYAGSTEKQIRECAAHLEELGRPDQAAELLGKTLPFLEKHGLLGAPGTE